MLLDNQYWYFFNDYRFKEPTSVISNKTRTFTRRSDYECYLLVSAEVLDKLRHEEEVSGYSAIPSYKEPYPVFSVACKSADVQSILYKYDIQGAFINKPNTKLTYSTSDKYL